MPRSERLYLTDIVDAAAEIAQDVSGRSRDDFVQDRVLRRAVLQSLTVIGEAVSRLSDALRQQHPEVDWADIAGFRNRAIHAYFAINWSIVWHAAAEEVPELSRQVADILAREYPNDADRTDTEEPRV